MTRHGAGSPEATQGRPGSTEAEFYCRLAESLLSPNVTRWTLTGQALGAAPHPSRSPPSRAGPAVSRVPSPLLRSGIQGPLNVFARLDGPSPAELGDLGATRVTFGPGLQHRATEALADITARLR